jgi:hypothetical protein
MAKIKERDRLIVEDPIEVTPDMVKAGVEAMPPGYDDSFEALEDYMPDIFRAMMRARSKRSGDFNPFGKG